MMTLNEYVGTFNIALVLLSYVVAAAAAYCALELVALVTISRRQRRMRWLVSGAAIFGLGVWAMHFIGMLAFELPMPVAYHLPTVFASIIPAIAAAALAFNLTTGAQLTPARLVGGAVLMGSGIGAMHYGGMFAMRMDAHTHYDLTFLLVSVAFAVAASLFSLHTAFNLREAHSQGGERLIGALIMGGAVTGLHYSTMIWASHFVPSNGGVVSLLAAQQMTAPTGPLTVEIPAAGAVIIAIVLLGTIGTVLQRLRGDEDTTIATVAPSVGD